MSLQKKTERQIHFWGWVKKWEVSSYRLHLALGSVQDWLERETLATTPSIGGSVFWIDWSIHMLCGYSWASATRMPHVSSRANLLEHSW